MTKSKYIILYEEELPVLFNPIIQHSEIGIMKRVISAGFCSRNDDGTYSVWGESISLKVKSRPEDAKIIEKYLEYDL